MGYINSSKKNTKNATKKIPIGDRLSFKQFHYEDFKISITRYSGDPNMAVVEFWEGKVETGEDKFKYAGFYNSLEEAEKDCKIYVDQLLKGVFCEDDERIIKGYTDNLAF